MSHRLIIKDAVWQLVGRILSALAGLLVVKMISPYLGPYRFGDYKTVLDYFAIWGALADFGLYVLALRTLGAIKEREMVESAKKDALEDYYGKFVFSRFVSIAIVYIIAIVIAYLIPSYTANPYLTRGLPLGMMFSASFMAAGIVQLPLQLFWKMEQVSVALVGARVVQILFLAALMYRRHPAASFGDSVPLRVFLSVMFSVFISGVFQGLFVWYKSQSFLRLRFVPDRGYTWSVFRDNRQYGCAYFLSSFHTLFVSILFSVYYPTISGYSYVGMWSLALVFITILIIIPATLGNSMIHKIADSSHEDKAYVLGNFLTLMIWVGLCIVIGSIAFSDQIIYFVGGVEYLGTNFSDPGSNVLLPWLSLILLGSFVKQTYNYNFIAHHKQHLLFWINLLGVVVGVPVGVYLVKHYSLIGGLFAQGLLEFLFVSGAIYFSRKHRIVPRLPWKNLVPLVFLGFLFAYLSHRGHVALSYDSIGGTIVVFLLLFVPFFVLSYRFVRRVARGLSP